MIVLGAVLEAGPGSVEDGSAAMTVGVVTATTYLAHVLAHDVAQWIGRSTEDHRRQVRHELEDSIPILVSGLPPAAILGAGALDWLSADLALAAAAAVLVIRLATIGSAVERLSGEPASRRTVWSGVALAVLGTLIAGAKVTIG